MYAVELREDHFIIGPAEQEALMVHCQHVAQAVLRLHQKTQHVVAALSFGGAMRSIAEMGGDVREMTDLLMRALKEGHELQLHAFALVHPEGSEPRYVQVTKAFHFCYIPQHASGQHKATRCLPPRTVQTFDSIFLSSAHVISCLEAEGTTADPLRGWRATEWADGLERRAHQALRAGHLLEGCQALLLRSFLDDEPHRLVPGVGRLLKSSAMRLRSLGDLSRTMQGILDCAQAEVNKDKCNQKVIASMFHTYRAPVLDILSSDTCCNCAPTRPPPKPHPRGRALSRRLPPCLIPRSLSRAHTEHDPGGLLRGDDRPSAAGCADAGDQARVRDRGGLHGVPGGFGRLAGRRKRQGLAGRHLRAHVSGSAPPSALPAGSLVLGSRDFVSISPRGPRPPPKHIKTCLPCHRLVQTEFVGCNSGAQWSASTTPVYARMFVFVW